MYYSKIYDPKMFAKNIYRNEHTNFGPDEGDACIKKTLLSLSGLIFQA